jgi:hypothetical protein
MVNFFIRMLASPFYFWGLHLKDDVPSKEARKEMSSMNSGLNSDTFKNELKELVQVKGGPCVSIFMPTHRVGAQVQQNPIRLKNLLKESEQQLISLGTRQTEARELLRPAHELLGNGIFWRQQADGLAVFVSPDIFRTYTLPMQFKELSVATDRFHLKPLLSLFSEDGRFFVLALSQKDLRLLECTRYGVNVVELEGVPRSMDEALKYDDPEKQLQFYTGTQSYGGQGKRPALFHGTGPNADDKKSDIWRYCILINSGLHKLLREEQTPLILAGVDYLLPIYREANSYAHILEGGVTGNPELLSAEELHEKAWEIVHPHFQKNLQDALAKYRQLAGTGLASSDVREIVPAAHFGRVETLLLTAGRQLWGAYNPDTTEVILHEKAEPGDQDLLDLAAIQTFVNGGGVHSVRPEKLDSEQQVAAVFRY